MTQSYKGLEISIFETNDSEKAQAFSESLKNSHNTEGEKPSFDNPYSRKSLQALWNIADILSIALTYTPREWTVGMLRGFMADDINGKKYLSSLNESIEYIDSKSMLPTPFIVDDTTYQINVVLIDFVKSIRHTKNGNALLETLDKLCQTLLGQSMAIDKEVIATATQRIKAYEQYQNESDDKSAFHDADEGEDIEFEEGIKYYDILNDHTLEITPNIEEPSITLPSTPEVMPSTQQTVERTNNHQNLHDTVENSINWNFYLQCLSSIAAVAGGAILIVCLLLPIPGLTLAGACLLGVSAIGYASSNQPPKEDESCFSDVDPKTSP